MKDEDKTKQQLIDELLEIRQCSAELEKLETESKRAEEGLAKELTAIVDVLNDMLRGEADDTQTEMRLQAALERLLEKRTSFVVAHRLSTVRDADLVLVIDDGRIVERGTHESLLAENGVYARMYQEFVRE